MESGNRRRHTREYMTSTMECVLNDSSEQQENFDCIAADISESGICLIAAHPMKSGQEIKITNHIFPSPRTGIVRWSELHNGLYYKAGLEFN